MDFELSDDQEALRGAARDLLDGYASPARVRAVVDADTGFDPDLWSAMVDQGWTALTVPEDLGGLGMGWVEVAVLLEQIGAHAAPAPYLQHAVAIDVLARSLENAPEAGLLLIRLVSGAAEATIAATAVQAVHTVDGWLLDGRTEPAVNAPRAAAAIVAAETADGEALFVVDLSGGAQPAREPAMDRTRPLGWLAFESTPALRLGGTDAVDRFRLTAAAAHSAEMLGGAAHVLDLSVEYAKERHQFGQPIGSFQAVKHRCADMLVDVEGMRSAAYYAAWALSADDPEAAVAVATAKVWCSDASRRVQASALQVHGGIGFTWEHDLHVFLKRSQLDQISFGDAAHHRSRLAALLRARVEAGLPVI